jgi:hypothetical protein
VKFVYRSCTFSVSTVDLIGFGRWECESSGGF